MMINYLAIFRSPRSDFIKFRQMDFKEIIGYILLLFGGSFAVLFFVFLASRSNGFTPIFLYGIGAIAFLSFLIGWFILSKNK